MTSTASPSRSELRERFQRAVADLDVQLRTATPRTIRDVIGEVIDPPAVATDSVDIDELDTVQGVAVNPTMRTVRSATTGITPAILGVAAYGSVVLEMTGAGEEPVSLYPPKHVVIVPLSKLVADLPAAFSALQPVMANGGDVVVATGPSATADMGELVIGAHGPREVHVILLEDNDE